jgi:hypothetical protein
MGHRSGGFEGEPNELVGRRTAEVREKADAAGVVFFDFEGASHV